MFKNFKLPMVIKNFSGQTPPVRNDYEFKRLFIQEFPISISLRKI